MTQPVSPQQIAQQDGCSRRQFLGGTVATAAAAGLAANAAALAADAPPTRKIRLGWVGCGGRGLYLVPHFVKHGGFEVYAAADYRPDAVARFSGSHHVEPSRCFAGLSGYKRVIESGVEAIVLEVPPYFFAEQASAAVAAGLHVYMAKPVAVDVPGCRQIEAAARLATEKRHVFLVDYQLPFHPANVKVADLWRTEGGKAVKVSTVGISGDRPDLPRGKTIEPWLYHSVWDNHIALGGGFIVSYDIHAIDAALWLLGRRPVSAVGAATLNRPDPHSDTPDVISVVYRYADGLVHEHSGMGLANGTPADLSCRVYSPSARATVAYQRKVFFQRRGRDAVTGKVEDKEMWDNGPTQNIANFYRDISEGRSDNSTVARAVDGCLTCILGREAALRNVTLTMDELLTENKRLELDLTGLRA
jgi:predicted dehydrogenase